MIIYFTHAYMMKYGLGAALARFDGIDTPNKPLCTARIHKYSIMWRYFDQGLHEFLFKLVSRHHFYFFERPEFTFGWK